ncbi:unnamed protein product [Owenia fusiformis]|uniref:medium-chain acyl-CoA ligase n=1 Tax=Owenia fusiformis TaxID=6347 RepID=A0A8J1U583_OWEFU|nr:unnamed protein product [Owenia fusiformis]
MKQLRTWIQLVKIWPKQLKQVQSYGRTLCTVSSAANFTNYEDEKKNFKINVPEYFNFAKDVIDRWAEAEKKGERGHIPALWWVDDEDNQLKWNFRELSEKSMRVANALQHGLGLEKGDRVIVILPRQPEWWLLNIACIRTGTILIPGTTQLTAKDIKTRLNQSHAKCLITDERTSHVVDQIAKECPDLEAKVVVMENQENEVSTRTGWKDFHSLCAQSNKTHECLDTKSSDPMTIFFTSGTTALPKMCEHSHASYGMGHVITGRFWLDLCPTDIHWNNSDTGWAKSAWSNVFAPWIQGACVFVHHTPKFDVKKTLNTLQTYPITTFCTAPTAYRLLVQSDLKKYKFHSLRHAISAGEPLNPEVTDEWYEGTGQVIREGYGQSETCLLVGSFRCIENKPGSMGKPSPWFDTTIVDDSGREVGPNTEGDIAVKVKPNRPIGLFTKYVDDPEMTSSAHKGDYYITGDRAYRDDDGYFWFVGRSDDVINSAGYRIGPFEVENALIEHPSVAESAVVSSPDKQRGEVVKAFVILSEQYKNADKDELRKGLQEHVKQVTAPYKYPRKIDFVDELPKTVSGKIRRVELRNQEWHTGSENIF